MFTKLYKLKVICKAKTKQKHNLKLRHGVDTCMEHKSLSNCLLTLYQSCHLYIIVCLYYCSVTMWWRVDFLETISLVER